MARYTQYNELQRSTGAIDLVSLLPEHYIISHRGMAGVYPEETMVGIDASLNTIAPIVEIDVRVTSDGVPVLMHDATTTRTTGSALTVSSSTAAAITALEAKTYTDYAGSAKVPTLEQVLDRYCGTTIFAIEMKDQTTDAMKAVIKVLEKYPQAKNSIIFEPSVQDALVYVKSFGYRAVRWWGTEGAATTASIGDAVSAGADFLMCDKSFGSTKVDELKATGLPLWVYTVDRRIDYQTVMSTHNPNGVMSDNPQYLADMLNIGRAKTMPWSNGVLGNILMGQGGLNEVRLTTNGIVYSTQYRSLLMGDISPVEKAAGGYAIDVDCTWSGSANPGSSDAISVEFAVDNDAAYTYSGGANSYAFGYRAYVRGSGVANLYQQALGTSANSTKLGSDTATGGAYTAGSSFHLRIEVTTTDVTMKVTRSGTTYTIGPIANTHSRYGNIMLTRNAAATNSTTTFTNLIISDL